MEEWKLKQMEEELRHEQAMRALARERLDAHDRSLDAVQAILDGVARHLEETGRRLDQVAVQQAKTESMLQDLIRAITREHTNGKGTE